MQRQALGPVISLQCVSNHSAERKPEFFSSWLRYLESSLSKRAKVLGLLKSFGNPNNSLTDQPAGVFLGARHGLDAQPRTASSKNRAAAQVTYG